MFEIEKYETGLKLSKWNGCVKFRKEDQTFQDDFPAVAQYENKLALHAVFDVEFLGRATQDV